jgi:hypothetical protein
VITRALGGYIGDSRETERKSSESDHNGWQWYSAQVIIPSDGVIVRLSLESIVLRGDGLFFFDPYVFVHSRLYSL